MLCDNCRERRGKPSRTAARSDLPLLEPDEAERQGWHLATQDYPELGEILWERPDLLERRADDAVPVRVSLSSKRKRSPQDNRDPKDTPWLREREEDPIARIVNDPSQPWWWRKVVGPAVQRFNENLPPGYRIETDDDFMNIDRANWCRFKRGQTCWFPERLDERGTEEAGYAVWVPFNRGTCPWRSHEDQKWQCPVSEPGPDSGERERYPDATIPWDQGGQRNNRSRFSNLSTEAAWPDVRSKGRDIMRDGGVRIIANTGMSVTAEVRGENAIYVATITRVPGTKQIAMSNCSCPWETYRWARSGRWKPLEGRMCSHLAALMFEMQRQEMFGGEITEQEGIPEWRTEDPVLEAERSLPGPWRLDVAASVLRSTLGAHVAHLDSVAARYRADRSLPFDRRSALAAMAEGMAEAARVDLDVVVRGADPLPGVAAELPLVSEAVVVEPFQGRVNGRILWFDEVAEGLALSREGEEVPCRSIVYPTFDPIIRMAANAPRNGVMVCLSPSAELSERLSELGASAGYDAEPPEQIHLTLAYLGKTGDVELDPVLLAARAAAAVLQPLTGTVNGMGTFANGDEHVLWAAPDIPGINEFRLAVTSALATHGLSPASNHGFTPHITVAYADAPIRELPDLGDLLGSTMTFSTLVVAYGSEWHHIDLVGASGETVAVEKVAAAKFSDFRRGQRVVVVGHPDEPGTVVSLHGQGNPYTKGYVVIEFDSDPGRLAHYPFREVQIIADEGKVSAKTAGTKRYNASEFKADTYPPFLANARRRRAMEAVARKIQESLTGPDSGFTFGWGNDADLSKGYQVGMSGATLQIDGNKPTPEQIKKMTPDQLAVYLDAWTRDHARAFQNPNMHLGGWWSPEDGRVHIDPSEQFTGNEDQAIELGRTRNQQAIWSNAESRVISSGGAGDADEVASEPEQKAASKEAAHADTRGPVLTADPRGEPGVRPGRSGQDRRPRSGGGPVERAVPRPAGRRGDQRLGAGVGPGGHRQGAGGARRLTATLDGLDKVVEFCSQGSFTHAGLVVKAADSGRVLMTQRTPFHGDDEDTYGKWEFPGGSIGEGEDPLVAALREFTEETGLSLPDGSHIEECYQGANSNYVAIIVVVPNEAWTTDAELLDLETMGIGWFDIDQIDGSDLARPEVQDAEWDLVAEASEAILYDEPEPALPVAYGGDAPDDVDLEEGAIYEDGSISPEAALQPGSPSLAWLMDGGASGGPQGADGHSDGDIAAAASQYLAKMALRDFSVAEQQEIINEGEGVRAANLDRLDVTGTFYSALEDDDDHEHDLMWM